MVYTFKPNDDGNFDIYCDDVFTDELEVYPNSVLPNHYSLGVIVEYVMQNDIQHFTVIL